MAFSLDVQIFMDASLAEQRLAKMAVGLDSYLNSMLVTAGSLVKDEMKHNAPVGVAGSLGQGLKGSIHDEIDPLAKTATIAPAADYALYVEKGTRPHMPPTDPDGALAQWCEMKGLKVWAVAKSIAKKGTKAHPFVEPTYEAIEEPVMAIFQAGVAKYVEETTAL